MSRVTVTTPTVGGSSGTWGTTLNTDLNALATATNALGTAADHNVGDFAAGLTSNATVKTSSYTIVANEIVRADATAGTVPLTLPTAPADGTRVVAKKVDSSANTVTVACGGSDVFNKTAGSTSLTLSATNASLSMQYQASGAIWVVTATDAGSGIVYNTRQVIAGTGLTGGGDLSADRTLTVAYGTSSSTAAVGNDSRITGAVQTTRTISNGYGVTGGGDLSANRTLAVALTSDAGSLGGDTTATTSSLTTLLTTASLGIGTWLITYGLTYVGTATAASVDIGVAAGSATVTFTGQQSNSSRYVASQNSSGSLTCIATITVAGTLVMQYFCAQAITLKATSQTAAVLPKATGYTATRIA